MSPLVKQCIGTRTERCTEHIPVGQKRCAKHALEVARLDYKRRGQARRGTPNRKVYDDPRWRKVRAVVLSRDPICVVCLEQPSTIADHWPSPLTALLEQGSDPFNPDTCRALCASCSGHHDGPRARRTNPYAITG